MQIYFINIVPKPIEVFREFGNNHKVKIVLDGHGDGRRIVLADRSAHVEWSNDETCESLVGRIAAKLQDGLRQFQYEQ